MGFELRVFETIAKSSTTRATNIILSHKSNENYRQEVRQDQQGRPIKRNENISLTNFSANFCHHGGKKDSNEEVKLSANTPTA